MRANVTTCGLMLALAWAHCASAQVARPGPSGAAGAEAARLAQQLQQASAERLQLQAEVKRLQAELETAKKTPVAPPAETAAMRQRLRAAESSAQGSRAAASEAEARAAKLQGRLDELAPGYRDATKALREAEAERAALQSAARRQHDTLATCVANNARLVQLNDEVVTRLERTGFWTKLAADEPFTRLKRTELENLADANRGAAAALAVPPPAAAPQSRATDRPAADAAP